MTLSKAQKRAFSRICSGIYMHKGEHLRFMTLTTVENMKKPLIDAFKLLVQRIRRRFGKFEYIRVRTDEGCNGVLHILFFGKYIPQKWLSQNWEDLTGAKVVDIRSTRHKVKNHLQLAGYCVRQYVAGQYLYERFSCSWGWCFRGYIGAFKEFIKYLGYENGIKAFRKFCTKKFFSLFDIIYKIQHKVLVKYKLRQAELDAW